MRTKRKPNVLRGKSHRRLYSLLSFAFFFFITQAAIAQTRLVTGTVIGAEDNIPLIGVNIQIKGTSTGTVTDIDGKYQISAGDNDVLSFSYTGYRPVEETVGGRSVIDVTLSTDSQVLDEVVVIGYGTAERKEITNSVVSVDADEFNKGNVNDPAQLLQGKVAGLSIARPGGDPNAGFNIRLRGLSTFGANSQPLIVIDGVVGGSLQLIDPNDIESIEVLKDGSAAAIYGTRGASGVIIVTTKKASLQQKGNIDFNTYVAVEDVAKFVENSTPAQYREAGGVDNGSETNWLDMLTRTGVSQVYNLSAYNNFGNGDYRVSLNYRDVQGVALKSGFNQINGRLNLNQRVLNDKLKLSVNLGITRRQAQFTPYESMRFAIIADPTAPVYNNNDPAQGYWEPNTPEYHNPYAISQEVTDDGKFNTLLGSARLDYELVSGLNIAAFYSNQQESDLRSQYFSSKTRFTSASGQKGRANKFAEQRKNELFEVTTTLKRALGNLNINAVAGYSWQEFNFENFNAFNTNFITDDLLYNALELGLGTATGSDANSGMNSQKEEARLISFFGRVLLNFNDSYFLSMALRREGSSKFGVNNRWGNFYSLSGGVDLVQAAGVPMNVLKLRVGYGVTGNLPNQNYEYLTRLSRGSRIFFNNQRYLQGVNFASNPNPDLKWEQKAETNIGLDYGFANNRITGAIDYYVRNTTDVLQSVSVPVPPNFYSSTLLNIGELKSNGFEFSFNWAAVQKPSFSYNTGIVFSTFNTDLVQLDGERDQIFLGNLGPPGLNGINVIRVAEGQPIGDIMAPIFEGLDDQGRRIITDQNGDGTISQEADAVVVGNGLPDFEMSWNNSITIGDFDLSAVIRGAFGHSLVNINRAYYESPAASNNYNPVRTKYYLPELTEGESWNSYYVEKADFVKLDNITLGYTPNLPGTALRNLRLYISAQNLFVITDYTGVDPEVHYSYGSVLAPGVDDRNSYFRTKTVTFGLNVGF
ncbi:MAG: SusC/RagA family TonB-linked outer membrane protein [Saprospiraceae bacterium]|nr:SusC/RagA family TonB-linked outer membrane protein [Lewinella sp.]